MLSNRASSILTRLLPDPSPPSLSVADTPAVAAVRRGSLLPKYRRIPALAETVKEGEMVITEGHFTLAHDTRVAIIN